MHIFIISFDLCTLFLQCDYLTSFGSTSDERKAATTIMQKVMYNSLAKNYNFDGHGEKIGFKTLNLWTVIEGKILIFCYFAF